MRFKNKYFPINLTIFSSFTISLIIFGSCIIGINYKRNLDSSLENAYTLMEKDTQQVFMKIENLYEPLLNITDQSSELPIFGEKPTLQNHPAESYLLNSMDEYPQIQILYMGFEDGDFYEILSCKGDLKNKLQETVNAPVDTEFAILRQFSVKGVEEPVRIWRFLNNVRQTIGSKKEVYTGYDPRERPWYKNAKKIDGSIKTDAYYFTNIKQMGITISRQIDGSTPGVLGADILMYEMSSFLDDLKKSEENIILTFNKDMFITSSQEGFSSSDHQLNLKEIDSPLMNGFYDYLNEVGLNDEMNLNLNISGVSYLIKIKKLPERYSNNEYLFIALPMKIISAPINKDLRFTVYISILIMILSLPIFLYIARRISLPINQLAFEAAKIGRFELDKDIVIHTRIKETKGLTDEMASMKRGLRVFNKYVPSKLVQSIMLSDSKVTIGGVSKEMTFMFTDIEGFTSITEKTEPELLMKRLSEYLELISSIIRKHQGTVDKFIGDSVMAFWNAPLDDSEHIKNCCIAAIEIQKELDEFNSYWASCNIPVFNTRIGIDSGVAVVGNLGCLDRMNYTAIGDSVNSSSRLEGLNKYYGTRIITGEIVANKLNDIFLLRPLEKIVVKGKTQSQFIFELIGFKDNISNISSKFVIKFNKGFHAYYEKKWLIAIKYFNEALEIKHDIITDVYIKSSEQYLLEAPDDKWNGVKVMEVK